MKVEVFQAKLGELGLKLITGEPGIHESSKHHVSACSCNTVKVGRAHGGIGKGIGAE